MLEGEIIKYYRQKAGITQEELGRGICSVTHVSKIERGQTPYSPEIISLFSERLHIDIENEVKRFKGLGNKLQYWHKLIIFRRMKEIKELYNEIESIPIIESSPYGAQYLLLKVRYFLLLWDLDRAQQLLSKVRSEFPNLPPYEKNLFRHVQGIYYLYTYRDKKSECYQRAIHFLKEIDREEYGNFEYYYHLAAAYTWMNSPVLAYSYAEKSLQYFKETDNLLGAIMAKSIMLISIGRDMEQDFDEIEEAYLRLIHNSDALNASERKIILLNNLGNEYYRRKDYEKAKKTFHESLPLVPKPSGLYLQRWHGYLLSCYEGKLMRKSEMLKKAREGLRMSTELDNTNYKILFKLLIYRMEGDDEKYYSFIEKEALTYFESGQSELLRNRYGKELYHYYVKTEQYEKAVQVSNLLIDSIISE
jgi:HTH-type transcriptional regulator, quorum sensing regulator NprR